MFDTICVVCIGNICRSPIGERLLQQAFPNKIITSAGLGAMVGQPAYTKSVDVAAHNNLSLEGHCARQLTRSICIEQDLILVMEKHHIDGVCKIAPEVRGKVMLYGHWLDQLEIADPYGKNIDAFERTYTVLEKSAQAWISKLK